jgi:hypothetical protein
MADDPDIPTRSGAFSDVYKASFGGKCVAVKVFRETASKYEMKRVEKVLLRFPDPILFSAKAFRSGLNERLRSHNPSVTNTFYQS